jgi:tetratricopeptide (TPR) repeat protein/DNA-binding CsgD family transcriptional regulator
MLIVEYNKTNPTQGIHYKNLGTINGVRFTPREIDVIACLLSGRATKTICRFLSIEEKTVETHKYNIMRKLECNSKESIINFIEKSDKFLIVKEHYFGLLIQSAFEKCFQEIQTLTETSTTVCSIVCWRKQENKVPLVNHLEKHLKLAGIRTLIKIREDYKSSNDLIYSIEPQPSDYILYAPPETFVAQLQDSKSEWESEIFPFIQTSSKYVGKLIFLLNERDASIDLPQEIQDAGYIDFGGHSNYYFAVFDVLQKILPKINLEKVQLAFKKHYEAIYGSAEKAPSQLWLEFNGLPEKENLSNNITPSILKNHRRPLFTVGAIILGIFSILFFMPGKENKSLSSLQIIKAQEPLIRPDLPLPQVNAFLERPNLVAQIEEKLNGDGIQTVALTGIGGVGKTTLARQYMRIQKSSIMWEINAETKDSLIASFENLASTLSKTEEEKKILRALQDIKDSKERREKIIQFVKDFFKLHPNWLLVFDNVENFAELEDYFPSDPNSWGKGRVIITTRDGTVQNYSHINNTIHIEGLNPKEKLNFFIKIMNHGNTDPSVNIQEGREEKEFLKELPPFPLDITIAAYYLKLTHISYRKYLECLRQSSKDFEEIQEKILKEAGNYTKTRYSIITLSLKKLIEAHKDFKDLLLLISLIDSQDIPRALLDSYKNNIVVDSFIYSLKKYSLVTNEATPSFSSSQSLSIHRITQIISLNYFIQTLGLKSTNPVMLTISDNIEKYIEYAVSKADYTILKSFINHCETFLSHKNLLEDPIKGFGGGRLGIIHFYCGNYVKAKELLEESLKDVNRNREDARVASMLIHLGMVYTKLGNYEKAKDLTEQGRLIYKKNFPDKHLEYFWSLVHLGIIYRNLGDLGKSEILLDQGVKFYRKYFSEDTPSIAWALAHLGNIYRNLGKYEEAKHLLKQSISIYKKNLPDKHIEIARPLIHLGNVYRSLGAYQEAESLVNQSLMIYKEFFGKDHIGVAWCLGYLGKIYRDLGYYEKSKDLLEQSLSILEKNLSKNHIRSAWISTLLGKVYKDLGHYKKSKDLLEESLIAYEKHFGKTHVSTAWVLECLGEVHKDLGDYENAKRILNQTLIIYEKEIGKDHIKTARVLNNLGQIHLLEGHIENSEELLLRALEISHKKKFPESYKILENLAELSLKKSTNEAEPQNIEKFKIQSIYYLKQALAIVKTTISQNSPHIRRIESKLKNVDVQSGSIS